MVSTRSGSTGTDQRLSLALRRGDWPLGGQQPVVRATRILKGGASRHRHRAQRVHQSAVWPHAKGRSPHRDQKPVRAALQISTRQCQLEQPRPYNRGTQT